MKSTYADGLGNVIGEDGRIPLYLSHDHSNR